MSQQNPIRVFVTHCWQDSDDYSRVFEYLESARNFFYRNTGTPDKPPTSGATEIVRDALRLQIDSAEVVIALASLHATQPDLTIFQMNYAQSRKKPVILMRPFGSSAELPRLLTERANETTEWEQRSLSDAVRRLARQENTARYETIEFNPEDFRDFKRD
jgi:nucleoside 2-deoxyribosyltransferase